MKQFNIYSLPKSQKGKVRSLIDKGIEKEYQNSNELIYKILTEWKKGNMDNKTTYMKVYDLVRKNDKHISQWYDRLTGSNYGMTLLFQLRNNIISEEDLDILSPDCRKRFLELKQSI